MARRTARTTNTSGDKLSTLDLGDQSIVWNHQLGKQVAATATFEAAENRMNELAGQPTPADDSPN